MTERLGKYLCNVLCPHAETLRHVGHMVAHVQILVLGKRAKTPSSWLLASAAGAYLQVTSDK